jgi:sarcosine oxidase/L-pipecolate oxidase
MIMKQKSDSQQSYLIVGAGCFGASMIYHLKRELPSAQVILLDPISFPNPSAARHDLNKIFRADNQDIFYMTLAIEAQERCRISNAFYHESGMLHAEDKGMARAIWTMLMPSVKTTC